MLVCAGASMSVCIYVLRIVSTDKILRLRNTLIIIIKNNAHNTASAVQGREPNLISVSRSVRLIASPGPTGPVLRVATAD